MEHAANKKRFSAYRARRRGSRPLLTLEPANAADDVRLGILDFMQRYDVLPPSYVKAQPFSTPAYIEKCLTILQKGHYVGIPKAQPKDIYAFHWLEVWSRGFSYLGDRALGRALVNDPFPHKCLRSVIKYHRDQLPALVTPLSVPSIELRAKTLHPDNHWKIEYRDVETATMYFFEEDDTGTERGRGDEEFERNDKSLRTMIREYNEYFVQGHYLNQFPTISILIHTTKKRRVDTILSILDEPGEIRALRLCADEIFGALEYTDSVHEVAGAQLVGFLPLIAILVGLREHGVVVLVVLPDGRAYEPQLEFHYGLFDHIGSNLPRLGAGRRTRDAPSVCVHTWAGHSSSTTLRSTPNPF